MGEEIKWANLQAIAEFGEECVPDEFRAESIAWAIAEILRLRDANRLLVEEVKAWRAADRVSEYAAAIEHMRAGVNAANARAAVDAAGLVKEGE